MEKKYDELIGKTKKEVLIAMGGDQFNDPHSNVWIFFLEKRALGRKKFLRLFFVNNIVKNTFIITKNFWQ